MPMREPPPGAAHAAAWIALLALLGGALPAAARGSRYERAAAARGHETDTSARLGGHAFINDRRRPPWRLALFVDTLGCRHPQDPDLLVLRFGLGREGPGPALRIAPERFRLSWSGGSLQRTPSSQAELRQRPGGLLAWTHDARWARLAPLPLPFDATDGLRIPTRFLADPSETVLVVDDVQLTPGAWLVDWLAVPLPAGTDRWEQLFALSLLGPADEPLVTVRFRVEPDPGVHGRAFRRAQRALRAADREYARDERRAARRARRAERRREREARSAAP